MGRVKQPQVPRYSVVGSRRIKQSEESVSPQNKLHFIGLLATIKAFY